MNASIGHQQAAEWLRAAQSAVAFTGAGISTESGIPDFRSPGGVWSQSQPVYYDDFLASAAAREEYWRQKALTHVEFSRSEPNAGHDVLARWEAEGRLSCVITQNIDGLHQQAGSQTVFELHGTAREVACLDCRFRDDADPWVQRYTEDGRPPDCPDCGGLLKHATVSFGQSLPREVLAESIQRSQAADVYLAMGSSLVVEPAASLPRAAKTAGARLILINRDPTPLDDLADLVLNASIGAALTAIDQRLREASD